MHAQGTITKKIILKKLINTSKDDETFGLAQVCSNSLLNEIIRLREGIRL